MYILYIYMNYELYTWFLPFVEFLLGILFFFLFLKFWKMKNKFFIFAIFMKIAAGFSVFWKLIVNLVFLWKNENDQNLICLEKLYLSFSIEFLFFETFLEASAWFADLRIAQIHSKFWLFRILIRLLYESRFANRFVVICFGPCFWFDLNLFG